MIFFCAGRDDWPHGEAVCAYGATDHYDEHRWIPQCDGQVACIVGSHSEEFLLPMCTPHAGCFGSMTREPADTWVIARHRLAKAVGR